MLQKEQDFRQLFDNGLKYVYSEDEWDALRNKRGKLYPSLIRETIVNGEKYIEESIQPILHPVELTDAEISQLRNLARLWPNITMLQSWLVGSEVLGKYWIEKLVSSSELQLLSIDAGYSEPWAPLIRLDLVRTATGFKIIDINYTRPAGVADNFILDRCYGHYDEYLHFNAVAGFCSTIKATFDSWLNQCGHGKQNAKIIILLDSYSGDWYNMKNLADALRAESWVDRVEVAMAFPDNKNVNFNCLIRGKIKFGHQIFSRLLSLNSKEICIVTPLGRRYLGNKYWFYLFSNGEVGGLLRQELGELDYELLTSSCLMTGILQDQFVEFSDSNHVHISQLDRERWLLKPPSGSSGKGIAIGACLRQPDWFGRLLDERNNGAIIQPYQPIQEQAVVYNAIGEPQSLTLYTKYGAFLYNGELVGVEVMARPSPLVHGARDTYLSVGVAIK